MLKGRVVESRGEERIVLVQKDVTWSHTVHVEVGRRTRLWITITPEGGFDGEVETAPL